MTVKSILKKSRSLCDKRKHLEAVCILENSLESHPDSAEIHQALAKVLYEINRQNQTPNYDQAIIHIRNAIRIAPDVFEYRLFHLRLLRSAGMQTEFNNAVHDTLEAAVTSGVPQNLTKLAFELGPSDTAAEAYRIAIRLDPERLERYDNLVYILEELQRYAEAVDVCETIIELTGNSMENRIRLARVLYMSGDTDRAMRICHEIDREFQETSEVSQLDVAAYAESKRLFGLMSRDHGDIQSSIDAFRTCIELQSEDYETRLSLTHVLLESGQFDEAALQCKLIIAATDHELQRSAKNELQRILRIKAG